MNLERYPRTPHLPNSGAITKDDLVMDAETQWDFLNSKSILIEEKLDGANVRIRWDGEGDLTVGNREHRLSKGYKKRETPAKLQFRPLWNWIYDHRAEFINLTRQLQTKDFTLYAEWMYAEHTIRYENLPTLLFPFAIKLDESRYSMDPFAASEAILLAGFHQPPQLIAQSNTIESIKKLMEPAKSVYSRENREGIYIKCGDGKSTTHILKFVRADFKPITDFTERGLRRNGIPTRE